MAERVRLIGPDGDEFTTDQPAEVVTMVTVYGYRRADEYDQRGTVPTGEMVSLYSDASPEPVVIREDTTELGEPDDE